MSRPFHSRKIVVWIWVEPHTACIVKHIMIKVAVFGPRVHLPAIIMSASMLAYSCTRVHTKHTCTQPGHPAFTIPQSAESLKMLSKRAKELKVVHTLNTFLISAFDKSISCRSPHSVLFPICQSTLESCQVSCQPCS